jgi:predicted HTH transcriptional regulator
VDAIVAGQELRSLMQEVLVEQQGASRWTYYTLKAPRDLPQQKMPVTEEERILAYVREHESISNAECREILKVDNDRAYYLLKKLCDSKRLKAKGKGKARQYVIV